MSITYTIKRESMVGIADAIRAKNGSADAYNPAEMAQAIAQIQTGGGNATFNIAYGDAAPEDTSKLWVKTDAPAAVEVTSKVLVGNEELESYVAVLPVRVKGAAAAAVGGKIYLFGGNDDSNYLSAIYVFDPEMNTIVALNVTLPAPAAFMAAAAVGTKVYLFGGRNDSVLSTIVVFDTESNTISTLSTALPQALHYMAAAAVGTKVYLFAGRNSNNSNSATIYVFSTEDSTIATLGANVSTLSYGLAAATVGTKVYLFGGRSSSAFSTIRVLETQTNTISTLSVKLPVAASYIAVATVGTKVYLFGGYGGGNQSSIQVFDTESDTLSTLSAVLPSATYNIAIAAVGTNVYLFGGYIDYESVATIHAFTVALPLAENTILVEVSNTKNMVNLLPNLELGVTNVYRGNADACAEKVAAALYKDGAWVEI